MSNQSRRGQPRRFQINDDDDGIDTSSNDEEGVALLVAAAAAVGIFADVGAAGAAASAPSSSSSSTSTIMDAGIRDRSPSSSSSLSTDAAVDDPIAAVAAYNEAHIARIRETFHAMNREDAEIYLRHWGPVNVDEPAIANTTVYEAHIARIRETFDAMDREGAEIYLRRWGPLQQPPPQNEANIVFRREADGNETPSSSSSSAMSMSSDDDDKSEGNSNNMDVSSNNGTTAKDDGITVASGIVCDAPDVVVTDAGTARLMDASYSTFLRDNAEVFEKISRGKHRSDLQVRFPCPKGLHPSFLLSLMDITYNKQVKAMEWIETISECPYCTFQLDGTLTKVELDIQLNENKKKALIERKRSTGDYGEYIFHYYMCQQRYMDVDANKRSAYQQIMAFENARADAVFAINTELDPRLFFMNIQIKCTIKYTGYDFFDDQDFYDLFQQQDYLLVTIQQPINSDIADEPVQILVGFVHEYKIRKKPGPIKKNKNSLAGYVSMIKFDDNKHLEVPHTLVFRTVVKKFIHFLFKAKSEQVQCESDLQLAIAPQHGTGVIEYKNYRETFKNGRVKDSESTFLYYYVYNPTRSHYDNEIIVQVKNESAHKVQANFLSYCCYCCNKYNRRSKSEQRMIGADNSYKCNSCHHFTIVNDDTAIFVIVTDQSKTNADLRPNRGLYHRNDFDAVRMVVGNESYFVPTAQLSTNKDGFIKKLEGTNNPERKRQGINHVCRFHLYRLTTRNKIDMKTICEIVRKENEDKTNPLLPSDFISFEPRQEIPPEVVTKDNIQDMIDSKYDSI